MLSLACGQHSSCVRNLPTSDRCTRLVAELVSVLGNVKSCIILKYRSHTLFGHFIQTKISRSKYKFNCKYNKHIFAQTLKLQSLHEDCAIPEADFLLLFLLCVPGSVMIPDSGGDDIQHQGEPAQAEGGDQEDVQGGEVLDQGQVRPPDNKNMNIAWVSVADG